MRLSQDVSELQAFIFQQRQEIVVFGEMLSITRQNVKDLKNTVANFDKIHAIDNSLSSLKNTVDKECNLSNQTREKIYKDIEKISSDLHLLNCAFANYSKEFKNFLDSHESYKKDNHRFEVEVKEKLSSLNNELIGLINQTKQDIKKEFEILPKDVFCQNAELMKKLDLLSSENMTLISRYNEQKNRILILESKMKQLHTYISKQASDNGVK